MKQQKLLQRQQLRKLRSGLSVEQRRCQSLEIVCAIVSHPVFQSAKVVLCYASLLDEVDLFPLLREWKEQKTILLPAVNGNSLDWIPYEGDESLTPAQFGVLEPQGVPYVNLDLVDLVLVPGLGFDLQGGRIGFGRGFYDRFLSRPELTNVPKWGIAFSQQIVDKVKMESHDVYLDAIVTPDGVRVTQLSQTAVD